MTMDMGWPGSSKVERYVQETLVQFLARYSPRNGVRCGASLACTLRDRHIPCRRDRRRQRQRQRQELPATAYHLQILTKGQARYSFVSSTTCSHRSPCLPHVPLGTSAARFLGTPCHSSSYLTCRASCPAPHVQYGVHGPAPASPSSSSVPIQVRTHFSSPLSRGVFAAHLGRISHPGQIRAGPAAPTPPRVLLAGHYVQVPALQLLP